MVLTLYLKARQNKKETRTKYYHCRTYILLRLLKATFRHRKMSTLPMLYSGCVLESITLSGPRKHREIYRHANLSRKFWPSNHYSICTQLTRSMALLSRGQRRISNDAVLAYLVRSTPSNQPCSLRDLYVPPEECKRQYKRLILDRTRR